jgi:hypothetical protein
MNLENFSSISTRGRFIYGYLCIREAIKHCELSVLPLELDELFHEFVSSDRLDVWHEKVEDILPSWIIDSDRVDSKVFSIDVVTRIMSYYRLQPKFLVDMIDKLFWMGIANLYVAFNSEKTFKELASIVRIMEENSVPLPEFDKVKNCSANQRGGWGQQDNLRNYIN